MDSEIRAQVDRLTAECRELQIRLRRLSSRYTSLERRLQRVEESTVFRFLRWLGPKLAAAGLPVPAAKPVDEAAAYRDWVQETGLLGYMQPDPTGRQPSISVVLDANHMDRAALERTLASLRQQNYKCWELFVVSGEAVPPWLDTAVQGIVPSVRCGPLSAALESRQGEATLWMNSSVILDPDALRSFAAALDKGVAAVYSDWDHVDSDGRRHSPRFTPEYSPELMLQTPYYGACYLTAASQVRQAPRPQEAAWPSLSQVDHGFVRRIPRMLWHSQQPAVLPSPVQVQHAASTARVSIIICSRNPQRLGACLKALRPTLDSRHEIIVVAHSENLDAVARQYGARIVSYQGPFHFGVMNARGVQESSGEVLCFLNDDVFPSGADWLELMLAQAVRPDVGIVGALLLYPDGAIQHAGVVVDRWHPAHVGRFQKHSYYWPWLRMTREVSAVTGACMALRRPLWDELGGFDLQFPVNYNDIDLCLRASEKGYRILIETRAVLIHEEARTRVAVVRPEEAERFQERWAAVADSPDRYFNPQFSRDDEPIALPAPWTAIR